MDEIVSFASGVALLFMCVLVIRAYWPFPRKDKAVWYLAIAISTAFFLAAANTLYWQIAFKFAAWFDGDVEEFRDVGNYMDAMFKGGAAFAGYMHLKALWERLPANERKRWHPLEMPWYPRRRACVSLLFRVAGRK